MYQKPANQVIRNAQILFRPNFAGRPTSMNPNGGSREINIIIDDFAYAEKLISENWPVKIYHKDKPIRDLMKQQCRNIEERIAFLQERGEYNPDFIKFYIRGIISYKYPEKAPNIYKIIPSTNKMIEMTDLNIAQFDADGIIANLDVELQLSWHSNPTPGYSAYVKTAMVTINESALLNVYSNYEIVREDDEIANC